MEKITTGELHQAVAAVLMCFGTTMSDEHRNYLRQLTHQMANDMERGGEPNVAKLTRGLGDALVAIPRAKQQS